MEGLGWEEGTRICPVEKEYKELICYPNPHYSLCPYRFRDIKGEEVARKKRWRVVRSTMEGCYPDITGLVLS